MTRFFLAASTLAFAAGAASAQIVVYDPLEMIPAERLTEASLYSTAEGGDWPGETDIAFDAGWESIGEVEDLILDQSGQVVGIVAEVGGFLGIGEHDVFLPSENLRMVQQDDEWTYVTRYTEEELEALPELEDDVWDD
jgi:hypothetical protein